MHTRPDAGFPLTPGNIWGSRFFEGVYVGPTEEIPFRALLVTYLATTMPGKLRWRRFNMNWAGIIAALIFALLHANNFDTRRWPQALGQQLYAFALGVLYALSLEKSHSIVAPIIGHNVSDVAEVSDPVRLAGGVLLRDRHTRGAASLRAERSVPNGAGRPQGDHGIA